ncbi:MAG TPA: hypothetical protein VE868_04550 [Balneolaceae bacterium]|nr:hypothetical protein [Balneolaceae bacterium]
MKKILSSTILIFSLFIISQTNASAQQLHSTELGAGIVFGNEPQTVGLHVDGTYYFTQNVAITPDIDIYFPHNSYYDSFFAVDLNGHYIFDQSTQYQLYGLAGLNISSGKHAPSRRNESKLGLNIGVGGAYQLQKVSVFGEVKYVISNLNELVASLGVRVPLH